MIVSARSLPLTSRTMVRSRPLTSRFQYSDAKVWRCVSGSFRPMLCGARQPPVVPSLNVSTSPGYFEEKPS